MIRPALACRVLIRPALIRSAMFRSAAVILLLASPTAAQVVRVTSGQHDGFVRLALAVPEGADWQLGRLSDGYELRLNGVSRYDVSRVFQRIGREGLAAIWVDPASGHLRMRVDCACHAIPFQYLADVVVIDLREGPPPATSSFELALDGSALPPLTHRTTREAMRPRSRPVRPRPYDWAGLALDALRPANRPTPRTIPETLPAPAIAPRTSATGPTQAPRKPNAAEAIDRDERLAQSLLRHLSEGAAQGLVEFEDPLPRQIAAHDPARDMSQIRIETAPDHLDRQAPQPLAAAGQSCPPPEALALENWLTEAPVPLQFAQSHVGLVGEFDRANPDRVAASIRFLLALGFGAEALQMIDTWPAGLPQRPLWSSLAHVLDDTPDPAPAFAGLAACDTAAALWAILADPAPARGDALATQAILRSFDALPPHLRKLLGLRLVNRLIDQRQEAAAEAVAAALRRIPGASDPANDLVAANLALATADPARAEAISGRLAEAPGPANAEALVALIEARTAQNLPVSAEQVLAVEGLLREREGSGGAAPLARALVLARAGADDYAGAFAALDGAPQTEAQLWQMLWQSASDDQFLIQTVGRGPAPVAARISERLTALGLGKPAALWLATSPDATAEDAARAALTEADGRGALRLLAGSDGAEAQSLRARALGLLGDHAGEAMAFARAGMTDQASAARLKARDWQGLSAGGPQVLQAAASLAVSPPNTAPIPSGGAAQGALARARALADESGTARADLERLLAATKIDG